MTRAKAPCEDCISRKEVLDYIDEMPSELTADGRRMIRRRTLEEYISDTLPSVNPQLRIEHCMDFKQHKEAPDDEGIATKNITKAFQLGIAFGFGEKYDEIDRVIDEIKKVVTPQQKIGHCKNCKHFHELPYHTDILGKCIQHTGLCPKGNWYCADFEPQESEG